MATIEEKQKNHDDYMEEHSRQCVRAMLFKRVGFSCEEIARVMSVSESTVRALIKETEDRERQLMEDEMILTYGG